MIYNSILEAIGNTPMIRLRNMTSEGDAEILVKFEGLNVGGSIKTRTAYNMILDAEERGVLNKDSIIVEPTSGNQGIGLALVGAVRGYKVKIIMPDSVSEERRKLVRHYGAEVILVHDNGNIGLCIEECLALAMRMKAEDPRVFVPQQFENPNNTLAHKKHTALEIMHQAAKPIQMGQRGEQATNRLQCFKNDPFQRITPRRIDNAAEDVTQHGRRQITQVMAMGNGSHSCPLHGSLLGVCQA